MPLDTPTLLDMSEPVWAHHRPSVINWLDPSHKWGSQVALLVLNKKMFVFILDALIVFETKWDIFHSGPVLPPSGKGSPLDLLG